MTERTGWKVVRVRPNGRFSLYMFSGESRVQYRVRQWATPRAGDGPLCVFDNLTDAQRWADVSEGTLYECRYEPSRGTKIWGRVEGYRTTTALATMPDGTALARRVKLVRRLS